MPGPTTERLDDEIQTLRGDIPDVKIMLARLDAKLDELGDLRIEVRSNTVDLTALKTNCANLIGVGKWLGSIFLLATVYGAISLFGRLTAVEAQVKSIDGRLGAVEAQAMSIDGRLGAVEAEVKGTKLLLNEIKEAVNRRPVDLAGEQDDRFRRIARTIVDEAWKRPEQSKGNP